MSKEQTGIAAEFWFFSQLHRLGYKTYITLGNTKAVDIALTLNDGRTLTFDVKGKRKFGGSFQHLENIPTNSNSHFVAFVDLATKIDKKTNKNLILDNISCYIVNSTNINEIASHWKSSKGTTEGIGFRDKLIKYLKTGDKAQTTKGTIQDFKNRKKIEEIDLMHYQNIILTLEDFENKFYTLK